MDFFTFSLNNVLRDKESYVAFWLSSVFSIVVFFVFSANMNHPQLAQSESIQDIMRVAAAFIAVYSLGFLGLSLNAFLKRKRRLYGALRHEAGSNDFHSTAELAAAVRQATALAVADAKGCRPDANTDGTVSFGKYMEELAGSMPVGTGAAPFCIGNG